MRAARRGPFSPEMCTCWGSDMLLVIDVGNTNIVLGLYEGPRLLRRFRIQTVAARTADETGVLIHDLFRHADVNPDEVSGAIVSCVVPDQLHVFRRACQRYFGTEPVVVGPGVKTGMRIRLDNPKEVGADRIVNAVAAYEQVQGRCIIVDFGTATTFDVVSDKGEYLGGAIAPGYQISATALFNHANIHLPAKIDRLIRVVLVTPDMHRVHHSVHREEHDSNYGFALSIWDRALGTYIAQPRAGHDKMTIGLEWQDTRPTKLSWSLRLPFRAK